MEQSEFKKTMSKYEIQYRLAHLNYQLALIQRDTSNVKLTLEVDEDKGSIYQFSYEGK